MFFCPFFWCFFNQTNEVPAMSRHPLDSDWFGACGAWNPRILNCQVLAFFSMSPKGEHADSLAFVTATERFERNRNARNEHFWNFLEKWEKFPPMKFPCIDSCKKRNVLGVPLPCSVELHSTPVLGETFGRKSWTLNCQKNKCQVY